jgi:hypothetical protein
MEVILTLDMGIPKAEAKVADTIEGEGEGAAGGAADTMEGNDR